MMSTPDLVNEAQTSCSAFEGVEHVGLVVRCMSMCPIFGVIVTLSLQMLHQVCFLEAISSAVGRRLEAFCVFS